MKEAETFRICERADDLISYLYNELTEREARSFEEHRRHCQECDTEAKNFGTVRRSILAWRDQSLGLGVQEFHTASVILPVAGGEKKTSALAAIRGFFALSPWWMKGATAAATIVLCLLAGLGVARLLESRQVNAISQAEIDRRINEEVNRRVDAQLAASKDNRVDPARINSDQPPKPITATPDIRRGTTRVATSQKLRQPLTRAEREQLAADLRLVLDNDDDSLQLIGDRINR